MKKQQISCIASVISMAAVIFYFSSCSREEISSPVAVAENATENNAGARNGNSLVFPKKAHMNGYSYAEWSAQWWKWALELPPVANHPFNDDPNFDVTMGQSGQVWFLASPFGTVVRTCTIPSGKKLFLGMLAAEASDLEGLGNTAAEQLANAQFNANHIVNLFATIDGSSMTNLAAYRFASPQFSFTAPTPWYFGATGGNGTAVSDGYFLMIKPLSPGTHTIHYSGAFHFTLAEDGFDFDLPLDVTYHLIVQ